MANNSTGANATPRPHDDYYLGFILKIAAAFNVQLSEATQAIYLERLRRLSSIQIQTAASRTIEEWGKASLMPPLAFILERVAPYQELPVYTMPSFKQLAEWRGISREEIAEWAADGKEAQDEYISKLESDPKWREMAARRGVRPSIGAPADHLAAARNVTSQIPTDPTERAPWAREMAKTQGWSKA